MQRINVDMKSVSVSVEPKDGGGVVDGALTSYYDCPLCHDMLRMMALFSDEVSAVRARSSLSFAYFYQIQQIGRFVIVTTGDSQHGSRGMYGSGCVLRPFFGSDKELGKAIWDRLQGHHVVGKKKVVMPTVTGVVDMTLLKNIERSNDQIGSDSQAILLVDRDYFINPQGLLAGPYRYGDDTDAWSKHLTEVKDTFWDMVCTPRVKHLTTAV